MQSVIDKRKGTRMQVGIDQDNEVITILKEMVPIYT